MSKFFFELSGVDLPREQTMEVPYGLVEAKCHAVQLIAESLCHQPMRFWDRDEYSVTVSDEKGLILFVVELVAILSPALPARA
jgi:hypothetical protein